MEVHEFLIDACSHIGTMNRCWDCKYLGLERMCFYPKMYGKVIEEPKKTLCQHFVLEENKLHHDHTKGTCTKCNTTVDIDELVSGGKGISLCKKCTGK